MQFGNHISMEAIRYQPKPVLAALLIEAMEDCYKIYTGVESKDDLLLRLDKLSKDIKKLTGITLVFDLLDPSKLLGSHTVSVDIPNYVLASPHNVGTMSEFQFKRLVSGKYTKVEALKGTLDPVKIEVTGFYSQIVFTISLNHGMFKPLISERGVASIIAHELGHAWDYMESMGETAVNNLLLAETIRVLTSEEPEQKKFEIVKQLAPDLVDETTDVNKITMDQIVGIVQVNQFSRDVSRTNSTLIRTHMTEFAGDQFAARLGLAGDLMKATATIIKHSNFFLRPSKYPVTWWGAFRIYSEVSTLVLGGLQLGLKVANLTLKEVLKKTAWNTCRNLLLNFAMYPISSNLDIDVRVENVKNDLRGLLKDPNISDKDKKSILDDLTEVDKSLSGLKPWKRTPTSVVSDFMLDLVVRDRRVFRHNNALNSLSNNRLYELSERLRLGTFSDAV